MRRCRSLLSTSILIVLVSTACDPQEDALLMGDPPGTQGQGEEPEEGLGPCYNGMSTQLYAIDPAAPRCTLDEVPDFVDYVLGQGSAALELMLIELDEYGTPLQCHPYEAADGSQAYCVDVVDRFDPDTPLEEETELGVDARNFFIAYATDHHGSAEIAHWDAALLDDILINKPVELSVAGYLRKTGELVHHSAGRPADDPAFRLLKFDPRTCSGCGIYEGPNRQYVINPAELETWYPDFVSSARAFQTASSQPDWTFYHRLTVAENEAELMYRATGR